MSWKSYFPKGNRYFETESGILYCCNCLEISGDLPPFVNLIILDPPYFTGKWKWDSRRGSKKQYLQNIQKLFDKLYKITTENATIYLFHNCVPLLFKILFDLNHKWKFADFITLIKNDPMMVAKYNIQFKRFVNFCEYVIRLTKMDFEEVDIPPKYWHRYLDYMTNELTKYGLTIKEINQSIGFKSIASHWFWRNGKQRQPRFVNKEAYLKLQQTGFWAKSYEELRKEFEEDKKKYEPVFNTEKPEPNYIISKFNSLKRLHPTQKPLQIIEKLIKLSSNKGDLILDPFIGSGTTAIAAEKLNRKWVGIEINKDYCEIQKQRILNYREREINRLF